MWWSFVGLLAAVIAGRALFGRKSARAVRQAAALEGDDSSSDVQAQLSAKMRLVDAGLLEGRWREVVIRRSASGALIAKPYRPRAARSFDLSNTFVTGCRRARSAERWWFAGPMVLTAVGDLGPIEFGFGTAAEAASAEIVLAHHDGCERRQV